MFWTPWKAVTPKIAKIAKLPKIFFTYYKCKSRPEKSRDPGIWKNPVPENPGAENPGIENLDPARAWSP